MTRLRIAPFVGCLAIFLAGPGLAGVCDDVGEALRAGERGRGRAGRRRSFLG